MMFNVNYIEGFWLLTNLIAAVVTFFALLDARRDKAAIRLINGASRTLIAKGNVRREVFRMMIQVLLLVAVVPGLFVDNPPVLSVPVVAVVTVTVLLLINSVLDTVDRNALNIITVADVVSEFERIAAEVAQANAAAQAKSQAAIAVIDEKVDAAAADATREIARTDKHQGIQDNRITDVENGQ